MDSFFFFKNSFWERGEKGVLTPTQVYQKSRIFQNKYKIGMPCRRVYLQSCSYFMSTTTHSILMCVCMQSQQLQHHYQQLYRLSFVFFHAHTIYALLKFLLSLSVYSTGSSETKKLKTKIIKNCMISVFGQEN